MGGRAIPTSIFEWFHCLRLQKSIITYHFHYWTQFSSKNQHFWNVLLKFGGHPLRLRCFPRYTWGSTFPSSLSGEAGLGDAGSVGFILPSGTRPCNTKKASIKGSKPQEVESNWKIWKCQTKNAGEFYICTYNTFIYIHHIFYTYSIYKYTMCRITCRSPNAECMQYIAPTEMWMYIYIYMHISHVLV